MRLLKIQEQKKKVDVEQRLQVMRAQEIGEELESKRTQLNALNDDFDNALKMHRFAFEEEKEELAAAISALKTEVAELERRKKQALLPLEEREKAVEDEKQKLRRAKELLDERNQELDDNLEYVAQRLDVIAERELQVTSGENSLDIRRKGVEAQATSITAQSRALSDHMQAFALQIASERKSVFAEQQKLEATKTYIDNERIRQQHRELQFINERRALLDAYKTLERNYQRLQNQHDSRERKI